MNNKHKLDGSRRVVRNFTMEDLALADLASLHVFKSSLSDVISDFEKNDEPLPVSLLESLVTVGRGIKRIEPDAWHN